MGRVWLEVGADSTPTIQLLDPCQLREERPATPWLQDHREQMTMPTPQFSLLKTGITVR